MGLIFRIRRSVQSRIDYHRDLKEYIRLQGNGESFKYCEADRFPVYNDRYAQAGRVDSHYYLQDIYMAKRVIESKTKRHYDIGSRVDGFISHLLSSGIEVTMLDIRPLDVEIDGLSFIQTDATSLDNIPDESLMSLSSLHAVEHFGLGRYGDNIDPDGWKKALRSMQRKISRGGRLYLSVPIGTVEKLCFNAHRIFLPRTIEQSLDEMSLKSFAYINDFKIIECDEQRFLHDGGVYDCGLFVFEKN